MPHHLRKEVSNIMMRAKTLGILNSLTLIPDIAKAITKEIQNCLDPEAFKKAQIVMAVIQQLGDKKTIDEAMKGGHIILRDGGALYDLLKSDGLIKKRYSSHHSKNKKEEGSMQAGKVFNEFLIGKNKDGTTWFQFEAHSTGGIMNLLAHLVDYVRYKLTGKNVGQYGLSEHTESKAIVIDTARSASVVQALKTVKQRQRE